MANEPNGTYGLAQISMITAYLPQLIFFDLLAEDPVLVVQIKKCGLQYRVVRVSLRR